MDEWGLYLLVMVAWFLALEIPALRSRRSGDTLSEHVWRWLGVMDEHADRHRALATIRILARYLLVASLLWAAGHLAMGWWTT